MRSAPPLPVVASIRAHDVASGIDKSFKLAQLELVSSETAAHAYNAAGPVEDGQMLQVAFEPHISDLKALGWHVESAQTVVSVHRYFKNGKPRKAIEGYEESLEAIEKVQTLAFAGHDPADERRAAPVLHAQGAATDCDAVIAASGRAGNGPSRCR